MAKLIGPLHSFAASGKIAAMVFGTWRGIEWVRQHFIPANPQTAKQVNIRTALTLLVAAWKSYAPAIWAEFDVLAAGKPYSGFNLFMKNGLDQYIIQITIDVLPTGVIYTAPAPGTYVWS